MDGFQEPNHATQYFRTVTASFVRGNMKDNTGIDQGAHTGLVSPWYLASNCSRSASVLAGLSFIEAHPVRLSTTESLFSG
jgi:hypothetical protein